MLAWEAARGAAERMRDEHSTADPFVICRRLGVDIWEAPMPDGVSGMILKQSGADARIFIDSGDHPLRRRFTCAHELGHLVERLDIAGDDEYSFRDLRSGGRYDIHEFFADEFAGELLMPGPEFEELAHSMTPTSLARHFKVTASAVERRQARLQKNPAA